MECKVDGCSREATYKSQQVCQKHYFRMMRYGTYDTTRVGKAKQRVVTPNGYVKIYKLGHQLADNGGYAFEHRYVLFEKHSGKELSCVKCGAYWNWRPYKDHVDHIDKDKENNSESNLRPLCNACNTRRTKRVAHKEKGKIALTYDGDTKTPEEWSRDSRCSVIGSTLRNRIKAGWTVEEAITRKSQKG